VAEGFEVANVMVALNGDIMNTVPKAKVTAGEIAVLQAIHGADAVTEIEPLGIAKQIKQGKALVPYTMRAERGRLEKLYGKAVDGNQKRILEALYPGAAARIFERIEELNLVPAQFKTGCVPQVFLDMESERTKAAQEAAEGVLIDDVTVTLEGADEGEEGFPEVQGDSLFSDDAEPTPASVPVSAAPKRRKADPVASLS